MNDALVDTDNVDVEDLLYEVNKVLHTRFKNMYEGDMLLPNLDYNPDYEAPFWAADEWKTRIEYYQEVPQGKFHDFR